MWKRSSDGISKLYINGVLDKAFDTSTMILKNSYPLSIGTARSGVMYSGSIDDIQIYNRALTDEEILGIYNTGK